MKERKKRKKLNIKHTLMYIATYVMVTFGVALFMVVNSSTTLSSGNKFNFAVAEPTVIEQVLTSITENDNIEISATVDVSKQGEDVINVSLGGNVEFGDELTDIKVGADILVRKADNNININVNYLDNKLYLSMLGGNYMVDVPTLLDAVGQVTGVFGVDLTGALANFDTSALGDLGGNVQQIEGGYVVKLEFQGIVINLITDEEYSLQSVMLDDITLGDYVVKVRANVVARNNGKTVQVPDREFVDLSDSLDVIASVANLIAQDTYFDVNVRYGDLYFSGVINLTNNFASRGIIEYHGIQADIVYIDKVLYADVLGAKVKVNLDDYEEYLALLEYFGINIDTNIDVDKVFEIIENISLDVINSVHREGDIVSITLKLFGENIPVVFDIANNTLNSVQLSVKGVDVSLASHQGVYALVVPQGNYVDAKDLLQFVPSIVDIIESKAVQTTIELSAFGYEFNFDAFVWFADGLQARLVGQVFGLDVQVDYKDNNLYLAIDGARFVIPSSDIAQVIDMFGGNLLGGIEVELQYANGILYVNVAGVQLQIKLVDNKLNVQLDSIVSANAVIQAYDGVATEIEGEYHNIDIVSLAEQIKDILNKQQIEITLDGTFGDVELGGSVIVDWSSGLHANANLVVIGKVVDVVIDNEMVYITFDENVKLKGNLYELPALIEDIKANLTTSSTLGIANNNVLSYINNVLQINIADFAISVNLEQGIKAVAVTGNGIQISANIEREQEVKQLEVVANPQEYDNDITTISSYVGAVKNLISAKYISAIARVEFDGKLHEFNIKLVHNDGIDASLTGELFDKPLNITYMSKDLYVDVLGLKYYLTDSDIQGILNALSEIVEFDISSINITSFVLRDNVLHLTINNNIFVNLTNDNGLFSVAHVRYENINADVYLFYGIISDVTLANKQEYTRLTNQFDLVDIIGKAGDILETKKVSATAQIAIGDTVLFVSGSVDFANSLVADAQLTYKDYTLYVNVQDDVIYINACDMAYLYCNMSDISTLVNNITEIFGLDVDIMQLIDLMDNVSYLDGKLTFAKDNISLVATFDASNSSVVTLNDTSKYTNNLVDAIPAVKAVKELLDTDFIGANTTIAFGSGENQKEIQANVYVDKQDTLKLELDTQLLNNNLNVKYVDKDVYVDFANLHYTILEQDIQTLIDGIKDILGDSISLQDITVANFVLASDKISLTINNEFDVEIYITDNSISKLVLTKGADLCVTALLNNAEHVVAVDDNTQYARLNDRFDLEDILSLVSDVLDSKALHANGYVYIGDTQIFVNADVDFADTLIVNAQIGVLDYTIYVNIQNDTLYVNVDNMLYIQGGVADTIDLVKDVMAVFDVELDTNKLFDFVPRVDIHNGVVTVDLADGDDMLDTISAQINLSANGQANVLTAQEIEKYNNNVNNILTYVKAVKTVLDSTTIDAKVKLALGDNTYTIDFAYKKLDSGIQLKLSTTIKDKDITVIYADQAIYINLFGYKASVNVDSDSVDAILDAVFELLQVEDLQALQDKSGLDLSDAQLVSNVVIGASQLTLTAIDKLDITLNVANDQLNNVRLVYGDNVTVVVDTIVFDSTTPTNIEVGTGYDNLNDKLDILKNVRKVLDTYDAITTEYVIGDETYTGYNVAFDASVRFGNTILNGNIQLNVVPTADNGEVKNKIYASVYGSYGGIDAKIYLVDDTVYINILGLKIKAGLSQDNIDNILDWVNDLIGKFKDDYTPISLDNMSGAIDVVIPNLTNLAFAGDGVDLSVYVQEFKVNSTTFKDITLSISTPTLLDSVLIGTDVYDNNMTELGDGNYEVAIFDTDDTKNKNLVFYLNNFAYGQNITTMSLDHTLLGDEQADEFVDYTKLFDFVDALIDYVQGGEYAFTLNATATEYNPATNESKLYAKATDAFIELHNAGNGTTASKINIDYLYANGSITLPNNAKNRTSDYLEHKFTGVLDNRTSNNKMLYATYSNGISNFTSSLKLKINTDVLLRVGALALKIFDIDTSLVSDFVNLPDVSDMDVTNLRYLFDVQPVDTTDFESIDNMLSKVAGLTDKLKSIEFVNRVVNGVEQSYLRVNVEINDQVMELMINIAGGDLTYVEATNVQVTRARNLDIKLDVTKFKGTNNYNKNANHFDLTSLDDVITCFVNNSAYNDFHITGTLDVTINVIGINKTLNIPVDAKIKLVDRKPQVMITMEVPIISAVNNDMGLVLSLGSQKRDVKIYYADGYLYTYRSESKGERQVKQDITTLKGNSILEYVQYITGLKDIIMSEINKAMEKTINRTTPIDFTKVVTNYAYTSSSSIHTITINLEELANNDQLDTGTIKIYTSNYNGKKYMQRADLDIEMPLASSVDLTIKTNSSNPLKLVNIGQTVNMSELTSFISNYKYGVDEYMIKTGSSWIKEADKEYTITFDSLGGSTTPSDIVNTAGTKITLPTLNYTKTATVDNVVYTYTFLGWTLDSMGAGEIVHWTEQPRGDQTLYAVWHLIDVKYLISFVTNSSYSVNGIRASVGASVTLPTISGVKNVDSGDTRYEYVFDKWYTDENCTVVANITTMPDHNITLYAGWKLNRTIHTYTVSFNSNGGTSYSSVKVVEGNKLDVSSYKPTKAERKNNDWTSYKVVFIFTRYKHTHTTFTFAGWYTNSGLTNKFNGTVTSNMTLYAKYTESSYTCDGHSSKSC